MSFDGSRLEYKLDSRKLEWYKSKCPGGLSHAHGLGQKPLAGSVDYEGNRCSSEIRINVLLRLRWESPCLSFILLSICQCHCVNYCLIYLVTPVRTGAKRVTPPIC